MGSDVVKVLVRGYVRRKSDPHHHLEEVYHKVTRNSSFLPVAMSSRRSRGMKLSYIIVANVVVKSGRPRTRLDGVFCMMLQFFDSFLGIINGACVVTLEEVTPVTLVCGRWEEEKKAVFFERTCQDLVFIPPGGLGIKVDKKSTLDDEGARKSWTVLKSRMENPFGTNVKY